MTYAEEMEKFKQHLAVILADRTGIDAGDSIEELCNTIAIEYGDWKLGEEAKDMQKKTEAYIRGYSAQHSLDQINAIRESK